MKNYVVFDLEWNQGPSGREDSSPRLLFEIFEIGAVKLNEKMEVIDQFHGLIRPCVYRQIHHIISEVTHVSEKELEQKGKPFETVMEEFLEWCGEDSIFCTWGSMDLTELQRNMMYHGMEIPFEFPLLFYDVQKLFSLLYSDGKARASLDEAVEFFQLQVDAPFHRALEDAAYTAKVMAQLEFHKVEDYLSVDYFQVPEMEEEEFTLEFPDYTKFVSRIFETREEMMSSKNLTDVVCYKCRRMLRKKVRWFSCAQKFYLCLAVCPEHGFMKGKIRIRKTEDGYFYAVKTQKLVDEESAELVVQKKEETKQRRSERNKSRKQAKKSAQPE